jgi:hypothetical protein
MKKYIFLPFFIIALLILNFKRDIALNLTNPINENQEINWPN